jgi:hypothetical protein
MNQPEEISLPLPAVDDALAMLIGFEDRVLDDIFGHKGVLLTQQTGSLREQVGIGFGIEALKTTALEISDDRRLRISRIISPANTTIMVQNPSPMKTKMVRSSNRLSTSTATPRRKRTPLSSSSTTAKSL